MPKKNFINTIKHLLLCYGYLSVGLAWGQSSTASLNQTNPIDKITYYQTLAKKQNLAQHITWQRLFYAKSAVSHVNYVDFFLSTDGKHDLSKELDITLEQLFNKTDENSPRCRFPARSEWLIEQLNLDSELPQVTCTDFNQWFNTINPYTLTLVFASDYMGNPSSMFGHTLIRLDPPKKPNKNMDLVAYALNYAATTPPNENSAAYAFKGLTGKYGGEYSLMRYFYKTKEYGDLESRDMWEYELDLNPKEVQFLVKHIWEMQGVQFPYYFMDKNCSYALMGLIDLVRPNLNLQSQFSWTVIPIETVKAVKKAGLIRDTHYRPALESQLKAQERQYGKAFGKIAHQLAHHQDPESLLATYDKTKQAQLLEMAYDNLYFAQANGTTDKTFAQKRLRELLLFRSQLDIPKQRQKPTTPTDPIHGHGAKSMGITIERTQGKNGLALSHRTAYHALSDPQTGYNIGQLLFLNTTVQIQKDTIKLANLDILSVKSVNPITSYKHPRSWGTDIGYQQVAIDSKGNFSRHQTHGVGIIAGQMGYAGSFFDNQLICGGYFKAELQAGKALKHNIRLGLSPTAQCQWQLANNWQAITTVNLPYWHDSKQWQTQLSGQIQYAPNTNHAFRLSANYEKQGNQDWHNLALGFHHYY